MTNQNMKAMQRMQSQKKDWPKNDPSDVLQKRHKQDLLDFMKWSKNEEACQDHLIDCLGWRKNGKNSVFECPGCGHKSARSRLKKEGKGENRTCRLVFECKKCHKSPSPRSVTMMARSSIPLGFWFLCIYAIGLMDGKVPWAYLNDQRVKFNSGDKKVSILGRDLTRIILKILETCDDHQERILYARMVKLMFDEHTPLKSYLSWYKSKSWVPWRIAFKRDPYTLKMASVCYGNTHSANEVENVYVCNDNKLYIDEWLLLAEVGSNEKIKKVKWFYVSQFYNITDGIMNSDGYSKIALFLKEDKNNKINFPFELGEKFRSALSSCVGPNFLQSLLLNSVRIPPNRIFKNIADGFSS